MMSKEQMESIEVHGNQNFGGAAHMSDILSSHQGTYKAGALNYEQDSMYMGSDGNMKMDPSIHFSIDNGENDQSTTINHERE